MELSAFRNLFGDLQEYVCSILNQDELLSAMGAEFYSENSLDIEYQVKTALAKTGLACLVLTPRATYQGHNGIQQTFTCDELTLQIVENPVVNRPRLKRDSLDHGTAMDIAKQASDRLAGPQGGYFGKFTTKRIQEAEQSGLLVVTATFGCTVYETLSAVISGDLSGNWVEVPFVRMSELSDWIDDYLSTHMPVPEVSGYLPLSGGMMTGAISAYSNATTIDWGYDGSLAAGTPGVDIRTAGEDGYYRFPSQDGSGGPSEYDVMRRKDLPSVDVPTKLSELSNDVGFVTSADVVMRDNTSPLTVTVPYDYGFTLQTPNGTPLIQTIDLNRTSINSLSTGNAEIASDGSLVTYPGAGVDTTKLSAWQWIKTGQTGIGDVISSEHNAILGEVAEDYVAYNWLIQQGYVTSADISALTGDFLPLSGGQMSGSISWDYGGQGGPKIYGPYNPQQLLFQTTYGPDAGKTVLLDFGAISQADGQRTIAYAEDVWGKDSATLSVGTGGYKTEVDPGAVTIQRTLNSTLTKTMQNWDGFTYTVSAEGGTPTNYNFTYPLSGGTLATRQYVDAYLGDIESLINIL